MDTLRLLQELQEWNSKQIKVAKAKITENVSTTKMLGKYRPDDKDREFRTIARAFDNHGYRLDRSRVKCVSNNTQRGHDTISFLSIIFMVDALSHFDKTNTACHTRARSMVKWLMANLHAITKAGSKLRYFETEAVRFRLPRLAHPTKLESPFGVIARQMSGKDKDYSIPLVLFTQIRTDKDRTTEIAQHELPLLLTQGMIAYHYDKTITEYHAYVVTLNETALTVSKAVMSGKYLQSLWNFHPVRGEVRYYRSVPFDLTDDKDRRNFVRFMVGLFRTCVDRPEAKIRDTYRGERYLD